MMMMMMKTEQKFCTLTRKNLRVVLAKCLRHIYEFSVGSNLLYTFGGAPFGRLGVSEQRAETKIYYIITNNAQIFTQITEICCAGQRMLNTRSTNRYLLTYLLRMYHTHIHDTRLPSNSKADHPRMRAFSYAWSILVT